MRLYLAVTVTHREGPRIPTEDVMAELELAIDELELWVEDTEYDVTVDRIRRKAEELG